MSKIIIRLTKDAEFQLAALEADPAQQKRFRKVRKALGCLQVDRQYPSLCVHKLKSISHRMADGEKVDVWEAYVENNTPGAWRIIYHLGHSGVLEVIAIVPHL